jgi:hypothetical protein
MVFHVPTVVLLCLLQMVVALTLADFAQMGKIGQEVGEIVADHQLEVAA